MVFTYTGVAPLPGEDHAKLSAEIGGDCHVQYNSNMRTLKISFLIEDREAMHLLLGSWILQIKEFCAEHFGFPLNNMTGAEISRYLTDDQRRALVGVWKERKKKGKR